MTMRREFRALRVATETMTIAPSDLAERLTAADAVTDRDRFEAEAYSRARARYRRLTGEAWGNEDTSWTESDHKVRTVQLADQEWVWRCSCGVRSAPTTYRSNDEAVAGHTAHTQKEGS